MLLQGFVVGQLQANCFVVGDEATREVMVIDPGDQAAALVEQFTQRDYRVTAVIATHHHLDHTGGIHDLLTALPEARFLMHALDYPAIAESAPSATAWYGHAVTPPRAPDRLLGHGDEIVIGAHRFRALHCPGHTPGSVCIAGEGAVFTGDVLFQGSIGRSDFPGSDGRALIRSIREHLLTLPEDTVVYPGHGAATSIGEERAYNPFLVDPERTLGFDPAADGD
ncbi:MAG: MBL fold metallo-hydrolase [Chloroflexi bacterium]|nr:MBL fold metallo-hydrolase [Chloroflexota bacterium]